MSGNGTVWAVCGLTFSLCLAVILILGYTRWDWNSDMGITPTSTKAALTSEVPAKTSKRAARTTRAAQSTRAARTTKAAQTTNPPATTAKVCKSPLTKGQLTDGNFNNIPWSDLNNAARCSVDPNAAPEDICCSGACMELDDLQALAQAGGNPLEDSTINTLATLTPLCINLQ